MIGSLTRAWVVVVGLAACGGGDDGLSFPVNPGGGGGTGSSSSIDASVGSDAATDAGTSFRVCLLADARAPTTCAGSGAGDLTVTLGSAQATTAADGSFTLTRPAADLTWRVSGDTVVPSALADTSSTTLIPVISSALYDDMLAANDAALLAGDGSIIVRVTDSNTPQAGLTATSAPIADSAIYYDGASALEWTDVGTGGAGVVWIPSIAAGTATVQLDDGSQSPPTVGGVPVFDGTVTFVLYEIP